MADVTCHACGTFRAETGPLCWLCAHDHDLHADGSECFCSRTRIYPACVLESLASAQSRNVSGTQISTPTAITRHPHPG